MPAVKDIKGADEGVIRTTANAAVFAELNVLVTEIEHDEADWPEGYTLADAFDELSERVESQGKEFSTGFVKNIRQIQIALGQAVEVSDEELRRIIVTSGKKYWFKLDGKKYRFNRY